MPNVMPYPPRSGSCGVPHRASVRPIRRAASDARVYDRAAQNFKRLRQNALVLEDEPTVYIYRLRMGGHTQTGIGACFSLGEYEHGVIKKHERTRRDKEDDRTRHMVALGAQTGPVFLTYRAAPDVDWIVDRADT